MSKINDGYGIISEIKDSRDGYGEFVCKPIDPRFVIPKFISGSNMSWNFNLLSGPKFYIECGSCLVGFKHRVPVKNNPIVACPQCKARNILPMNIV